MEKSNKEIVKQFIDEVFNAWDLSRLDAFMREDYRQHSREVKDGREGFKEFAQEFFKQKPYMDVFRMAEDDDMVFVFFKCIFGASGTAAKVCDIYRLQDGKLAEHWDVVQPLPDPDEKGMNGNGHF